MYRSKEKKDSKRNLPCKIGVGEAAAAAAVILFFAGEIASGLYEGITKTDAYLWGGIELPLLIASFCATFYLLYRNLRQKEILGRMSADIESLCELVSAGDTNQENTREELKERSEETILKSMSDQIGRSERAYKFLLSHKEQLKQEYDFFTHILNETPNLVVWLKPDGTIKYSNPALSRSTGYGQQELLGKSWWDVFYPGGRTNAEIVRLNNMTMGGRRCIQNHVMVLKTKSSEDRYISWTTANILDHDGNPVELIGLGNDITEERKRGQTETEDQKMKALATLAGGLAHELSNALQPILGISEICAARVAGKNKELEENMQIIQKNALHCRNIVNGVLAFARRDVKKKQIYNLRDALEETMEFVDEFLPLEVEVRCHGFGDEEDLSNTDLPVSINRTELIQIMANLFTNASHAMQRCGIIKVGLGRVIIDGAATQLHDIPGGDYAVITVKDTGCGMTEEVQKSLFQPFFTTKSVGEGTGLGLAAVFGIMQDWNGAIRVQSRPGLGSTFFLYIPIAGDGTPAMTAATKPIQLEQDENGQYTRH